MAIFPLATLGFLLWLPPANAFGQEVAQNDGSDKELISKAAEQFRTEIGIRGRLRTDALQEARRAAVRAAFQKAQLEQQNARHRLMLRLDQDFTLRLIRLQITEPPETESDWIHLRKRLRSMAVIKTQERLTELEAICPFTKGQRQKLLLAAIADLKPIEREIANWEARYADFDAMALPNVRQTVTELRDLNKLLAEQIGEKSLVPKVFLRILTDEQARQLREACLLRFSDVAFAIGVPVEQRPDLMEVLRKHAEALPLSLDPREFRVQVLSATPIGELARVVGPDYAIIIKQTPLLRE